MFVMWYTYIIKSELFERYYIGYTGDLENRLQWHNEGKSRWSRRFKPWKLVYCEKFLDKSEAIKRERQIKSYKNKSYIEKMIECSSLVV